MYILTVTPFYIAMSMALSSLSLIIAFLFSDKESLLQDTLNSKINIIIHVNTFYVLLYLFGRMVMAFFIGKIRDEEFQQFQQLIVRYSMTNLLFLFYVLHPTQLSEMLLWITWFTVIGFLKLFGIVGRKRSQYYTSAIVMDKLKHQKLFTMLLLILACDVFLISGGVYYCKDAGIGPLLLLLFECWILLIETVHSILIYTFYLIDIYMERQIFGDAEQEHYVEFAFEVVRYVSTIFHYLHIWKTNGFTITVIDLTILYIAYRILSELLARVKSFMDYIRVRNIIDQTFPNATAGELSNSGDICAFCQDTMAVGSAKKLNCNHIFHLRCIKTWIQSNYTCPLCIQPITTIPGVTDTQRRQNSTSQHQLHVQEQDQQQQQHAQQQQQQQQPHATVRQRFRNLQQQQQHEASQFQGENHHWTRWLPFSVELIQSNNGNNNNNNNNGDVSNSPSGNIDTSNEIQQ